MAMDLYAELDAFDGKHTEELESLASRVPKTTETIDRLCSIAEESEARLQVAATWIVKRWGEQKVMYAAEQATRLIDLIGQVAPWEANLHLLQVLPALSIPSSRKGRLQNALMQGLSHSNKFVRAWSYNGLIVLADQHEEFRESVKSLLARVTEEEAASVRARVRNAIKGKAWLEAE